MRSTRGNQRNMTVCAPRDAGTGTVMRRHADSAVALFNSVFRMQLQLEQWGAQIDFLGARLGDIASQDAKYKGFRTTP